MKIKCSGDWVLAGMAFAVILNAAVAQNAIGTPTALSGLTKAAPRSIPASPAAPVPSQDFSVKLKWSDATGQLSIPFHNTSDKVLRLEAVQTSGNFFVVDFPKNISAKSVANIDLLFEAKTGTSSDSGLVRIKTDQGEKLIRILHDREQVAVLDKRQLSWTVGEAATGKSAILSVVGGVTKPVKVRVTLGNAAKIDDLGNGKYRITVTPKSTADLARFPVFIDLDPALPGVTPVITATIVSKN